MSTHLDDERLAQWALDGQAPDTASADHLLLCTRCRENLAELQETVHLAEHLPRLEQPPSDVWHRVGAELGLETDTLEEQQRVTPIRRTRRFRTSTVAVAASVAAVVGIGAGVIGTLLTTSDDTPPVAEAIRLEPLAGKSGDGTADLIRESTGSQLKVTAAGLDATQGFYEVWLINTDGKRMVSLGILNPRTGGTFQIPPAVTTQGYRIVDVSLEPDDGDPEHSRDSVIRGTLPG